jgi:C4-dicarboxylate-specific signal transduction histidine kinase
MPGIEGLELCRRVKTKHEFGFIYVILLTGRSNESDVVEGLDSGADDFMVKPIKADELKSRVAVGARNVEYERKLSDVNRKLQEQNGALEKYARIMESLAEDRAKQLVHAERLSTIGEMSAGIAHEINNYLSPVLGYTEMLAFKFDNQSELKPADLATCKDYLDCIGKGARRIRNLVERIRKHSRRAASRPVLTSVNEIIRQSLELTGARVRSLRLELNLDKDLPKVLVDPQELEQVFVNLIKNAADAMEAKPGLLRISSVASPSGGGVILKVADSGPGIPEDKLEHVFESFFTTKGPEKGTGLGLSVSRGIIERYGGNISASNGPSGGAVFTIVLPLPGEASGPASPQEHSQPWS